MRVVLVRHAKSDYPPAVSDHDRPLAPRGIVDAPAAGTWLAEHLDLQGEHATVVVSTAKRARQTWNSMRTRLGHQWHGCAEIDEPDVYEASASTLLRIIGEHETGTLVIVGHNPGLHEVVMRARSGALRDAAGVKFPTCAIAVLDGSEPHAWMSGDYDVVAFAVPRG